MILDGYWKRDLIKFKRQLKYWSRRSGFVIQDYFEHRINRCLLFSAAIIRKIVEDENDVKPLFDKRGETEEYLKMLSFNRRSAKK